MLSKEIQNELEKIRKEQEELTGEIVRRMNEVHGDFIRKLCEYRNKQFDILGVF